MIMHESTLITLQQLTTHDVRSPRSITVLRHVVRHREGRPTPLSSRSDAYKRARDAIKHERQQPVSDVQVRGISAWADEESLR